MKISWLIIPNFLFLISILYGTSGCKLYQAENGMTCQEKKDILHYHNERRSHVARGLQKEKNVQSPAENMLVMRWNSEMAKGAQEHADKCVLGHSEDWEMPGQGESLSSWGYEEKKRHKPVDAAVVWFTEVEKIGYNPGDYSQEIGHYSQMIWGDTDELGCGQSYFDDGSKWPYRTYTVCRYMPSAGNGGPYVEGQPDCAKHHLHKSINYEGLCSKATPEEQKAWVTCTDAVDTSRPTVARSTALPSLHLLLVIGLCLITLRKVGLL